MTNEKRFPKNISQWEFDFGLFTNLPTVMVARDDFSPSSFKPLKPSSFISYLSWQNNSHKKQIVWKYERLNRNLYVMLKFTEWPKTPGITSKKRKMLDNLSDCVKKTLLNFTALLVLAWICVWLLKFILLQHISIWSEESSERI